MMLSLAVVSIIAESFNAKLAGPSDGHHSQYIMHSQKLKCLVYYFSSNLMAVGALEALGIVFGVGQWLVSTFENVDWVLFEDLIL